MDLFWGLEWRVFLKTLKCLHLLNVSKCLLISPNICNVSKCLGCPQHVNYDSSCPWNSTNKMKKIIVPYFHKGSSFRHIPLMQTWNFLPPKTGTFTPQKNGNSCFDKWFSAAKCAQHHLPGSRAASPAEGVAAYHLRRSSKFYFPHFWWNI